MPCSEFHSKLNSFRTDETFCDVIINVEGEKFPCHRIVLAASSEYFEAMFCGSFKEKDDQEITLHEIDAMTFQNVLKFVYERLECEFTVRNIRTLLHASAFLGIRSLEECCVKFILENLPSIRDYIDIFIVVRSMNIAGLTDVLSQHIFKNFQSCYNDEGFLEMPYDDLKLVILDKWVLRDKVPYRYENLLLDLLIRWVHYSPADRRKYFKTLVELVDFERISAEYISFMLKYFKNLIKVSGFDETSLTNVTSLMKESTSASDSSFRNLFDIRDSMNRFLLKKEIVEYFTVNKKRLGSSDDDEMQDSWVVPKYLKGKLNLHVYIEYTRIDCSIRDENGELIHERLKDAKVFSVNRLNKYNPKWIHLGNTNAWYCCSARRTVSYDPFDLMYCFETFQDETDGSNYRQSFCTYSSIDMSLPSSVLTPPPVTLNMTYLGMCATQYGIVLYNPEEPHFFAGLNAHGLFHYKYGLDRWFTLPPVPFKNFYSYSHLTADSNLVYLIGGDGNNNGVVALDQRTPEWMKLGNARYYGHITRSCSLNGKLYMSNSTSSRLHTFDPRIGRWESLQIPQIPVTFLIGYEGLLWVISRYNHAFPNRYKISTCNPVCPDWHTDEFLINKAIEYHGIGLKELSSPRNCIFDNDIKEVLVFKT